MFPFTASLAQRDVHIEDPLTLVIALDVHLALMGNTGSTDRKLEYLADELRRALIINQARRAIPQGSPVPAIVGDIRKTLAERRALLTT